MIWTISYHVSEKFVKRSCVLQLISETLENKLVITKNTK